EAAAEAAAADDVAGTPDTTGQASAESEQSAESKQPAEPEQSAPAEPATTKSKVELKNLGYTAKITEDDVNASVEAGYKVGQITVNGSDFGKGNATIKIDKIDGKSAKALSDLYNQLLSDIAQGTERPDTDARLLEVVNHSIALFAANPVLRVDPFVWEAAKGQSNLNLAIELTKAEGLVVGKELPSDFKQVAQQAVKRI